jgi:hypothetical protein
MQREGLFGPQPGGRRISTFACHQRCSDQRFGAGCRRILVELERALEPTSTLWHVLPLQPELRHRPCQPHGALSLSRSLEPVESSAQIVDLALQPVEPFIAGALPVCAGSSSQQVGLCLLGEPQEMLCVTASELIGLARLLQALGRVLADRLQHPVALIGVTEQALVDE